MAREQGDLGGAWLRQRADDVGGRIAEPRVPDGRCIGMNNGVVFALLVVLLVGCSGRSVEVEEPASTTVVSVVSTTTTAPVTVSTTPPSSTDPGGEEAWSTVEAERQVTNFLAALAAGAYEQAAWPAENNGVEISGQAQSETPAEALERLCGNGACAGPYGVHAEGPGLVDPDSGLASSTVTVTHLDTGQEAKVRLATFEGQRIISDLPPLVPSAGGPTLVELLFGDDVPERLVVARFDAFEIWENGQSEWATNWWAGDTHQVEGDVLAGYQVVAGLREPQTKYEGECARLMTRDGEVLVLEQCDSAGWRMFEVISDDPRPTPIPFEERFDGEYLWFAERGGTVVEGMGDAEGNLTSLTNRQGVDLLGDGYASYLALSTNGAFVAYVDHADPAAFSHFWSPVVVVKDTSTGVELGRWTLDNPVLSLEFAESWLVAREANPAILGGGIAEQVALVAINIKSGDLNRVATPTRVFLPS